MALFDINKEPSVVPSTDESYNTTNVNLVKDNGDVPSGKKLVDKRLPVKFKYHFGGQSGWVTVPKGRLVSIDPDLQRKDYADGKYYNVVTIANGGVDVTEANDDPDGTGGNFTRTANIPVGVATMNVYQDFDDSFKGSRPSYATRFNINVPYFLTQTDAEKTEWGSAYGNDIKPGDKLMSDENGRFVKWKEGKLLTETVTLAAATVVPVPTAIYPGETAADVTVYDPSGDVNLTVTNVANKTGEITIDAAFTGDVEVTYRSTLTNIEQMVGQVIRKDINLIPAGWLKWAMPEGDYEEGTGFVAGDADEFGYPFDDSYKDPFATGEYRPTGIPGLTDGSNYIKEYSAAAEDTEPVILGEINDAYADGDTVNKRLDERFLPVTEVMTLKIGNDTVGWTDIADAAYAGATTYRFDSETGLLRVTLDSADSVPAADDTFYIKMEFKATHQMPGMPSYINFEGVAGSLDILMQL